MLLRCVLRTRYYYWTFSRSHFPIEEEGKRILFDIIQEVAVPDDPVFDFPAFISSSWSLYSISVWVLTFPVDVSGMYPLSDDIIQDEVFSKSRTNRDDLDEEGKFRSYERNLSHILSSKHVEEDTEKTWRFFISLRSDKEHTIIFMVIISPSL